MSFQQLVSVHCLNPNSGVLIFEEDVDLKALPKFYIQDQPLKLSYCKKQYPAKKSHYYVDKHNIIFYLTPQDVPPYLPNEERIFLVSGEFNNWGKNIEYKMHWDICKHAWVLKHPRSRLPKVNFCFKFVTVFGRWLKPNPCVTNIVIDKQGNKNLLLEFERSGKHWIFFKTREKLDLTSPCYLNHKGVTYNVSLQPWLLSLHSNKKLGAYIENDTTNFSCFAPTAKNIEVKVYNENNISYHTLKKDKQGVWSTNIKFNYENYNYLFKVWNPEPQELVDPYAQQLKSPQGPGIVTQLDPPNSYFKAPPIQDLIIMEVHARDLIGATGTSKNLSIFGQLNEYFSQPNYVKDLGINCIEFMPLIEFDSTSREAYHWGYMPAHYFAPSSCYGSPKEFQTLIETLHKKNITVILDVVFNHAGEMNDLKKWNVDYYFQHDAQGNLTNNSGCGNDLRSEAFMTKKLILDSCIHLLQTYNIDGFRFDLSELLGLETLKYLSEELLNYKSNVILISEPWSFRGHIAHDLKESPYLCWNDGFREFLLKYVCNEGNTDGLKYFIEGSTSFLCQNAQQSINYTESHDDYCWIDRLPGDDSIKIRRTHCMFATLFISMGIPMIAEGQDFLRSKNKVRNTYNRGDLNILNYEQIKTNQTTHDYVKNLIVFRKSILGHLLKIERPQGTYLKYFYVQNSSALCVLFNADCSLGLAQILFAINPSNENVSFNLGDLPTSKFYNLADTMRFYKSKNTTLTPNFILPPISCAIFCKE